MSLPASLSRQTRTGLLDLHFGVRGGKTTLLRDVQKAPLMIVRPFELPCGTLMVFIVNPTGGVLGGDHNDIVVRVDSGARVLILTQSATRIQPSPNGEAATQHLHFSVASEARLEYYPERTIPFAGSRYRQKMYVDLQEEAEFGATETLATGRVHSGEHLAFLSYESDLEVWQAGQRVYLDRQRLQPSPWTRAPGIWQQAHYTASGVWVANGISSQLPALPGVLSTGLTAKGAIWLRSVASQGTALDAAIATARDSIRANFFHALPLEIRR